MASVETSWVPSTGEHAALRPQRPWPLGCWYRSIGHNNWPGHTIVATKPTIRPISGLQLPLGGLAIDDSGTIYGAILLSPRAYRGDSRVHPELVRIDPGATTPIVLAVGHFSMPTVANHYCASW